MKRILLAVLMVMLCAQALAQGAPRLPETMLPALDIVLDKGHKYPVYQGPGTQYDRAGNGKASVSTNDWVQIFGQEDVYYLVQYGLSGDKMRIGWICAYDMDNPPMISEPLKWQWGAARVIRNVSVTDDPFGARGSIDQLGAGEQVQTLAFFGEWAYIQQKNLRGFVPANALEEMEIAYRENPAYAQAAAFLEAAGIDFTVTGMNDTYLYFDFAQGGSGKWLNLGSRDEYDPYDLRSWYFTGITDHDIALYCDAALRMAAQVERGEVPQEHLKPDYQGELGQRNIDAVVSGIVFSLSGGGEQWLRVIMNQLAAREDDPELNGMRARVASKALGRLEKTPVDPSEGLAWYDALTLTVQDDLPPVDAAAYVEDPTLRQVTQALIDYESRRRADWFSDLDMDREKACNIVALKVFKMTEKKNTLTVWANVSSATYALYDGSRYDLVNGVWSPSRIEMVRNESGAWVLDTLTQAQDGSDYAPSIRAFCDGDKKLADRMMQEGYASDEEAFIRYLRANGYDVDIGMRIRE